MLKGADVAGNNLFTLNGNGFVKRNSESGNIAANTAYYMVETTEDMLSMEISIDTSIDEVKKEQNVKFYDLKGNAVEKPVRGIYITSEGKKVLVL